MFHELGLSWGKRSATTLPSVSAERGAAPSPVGGRVLPLSAAVFFCSVAAATVTKYMYRVIWCM